MRVLSVQNLTQCVSVSPGQKKQRPEQSTGVTPAGSRDYAGSREPGAVQLKGRKVSCASMKGACTKQ